MPIQVIPFSIGLERMSDELTKYHISNGEDTPWPFTPVFHHFTGPDTGGPHDHPFGFRVFVIAGGYKERMWVPNPMRNGTYMPVTLSRLPGDSFKVPADCIHEIVSLPWGECWTMILPEERVRETHFYMFDMFGNAKRRRWDEFEYKPFDPRHPF